MDCVFIEEIIQAKLGVKATCYWICGADHAIRIRIYEKTVVSTIAIGRQGSTQKIKDIIGSDKEDGTKFVSPLFTLIETELPDGKLIEVF
jgi:hypothetical protein